MKKQPLVSIIMNCFNGETYLKESLESILTQSYQNWEIIFWDNQSTDKSAKIFKSYRDRRFRYFYAPGHTHLGMARNMAVEKAKGEWLAFLDCDDLWTKDKLEIQLQSLLEHKNDKIGLVYSKIECFSSQLTGKSLKDRLAPYKAYNSYLQRKSVPSGEIFLKLASENLVPLSSALVSKKAFLAVGGIDRTLKQAEDYDLFLKISDRYHSIGLANILVKYRIHENNLSNSQGELACLENIYILKQFSNKYNLKEALRKRHTELAIFYFKRRQFSRAFRILVTKGSFMNFLTRIFNAILIRIRLLTD